MGNKVQVTAKPQLAYPEAAPAEWISIKKNPPLKMQREGTVTVALFQKTAIAIPE
jgi:hypothetical protein